MWQSDPQGEPLLVILSSPSPPFPGKTQRAKRQATRPRPARSRSPSCCCRCSSGRAAGCERPCRGVGGEAAGRGVGGNKRALAPGPVLRMCWLGTHRGPVHAGFVGEYHGLNAVAEVELRQDPLRGFGSSILNDERGGDFRLDRPRATSSSTSRSRGVRSSSLVWSARSGLGCVAMRSITRRVNGDSSESPAAIVWTAAINSSGRVCLSRKLEAPARRAPKRAHVAVVCHAAAGGPSQRLARAHSPDDVVGQVVEAQLDRL